MERAMKSERITFLATPEFKARLAQLASLKKVSVGEVIRARFGQAPESREAVEERELQELAAELRAAVSEAQTSLREGIAETESALAALRKSQEHKRTEVTA